jgi:hypothetical protein
MEYEKVCLSCSSGMSRIVYGHPSQTLLEIKEEKGWILGGCTPLDIKFLCKNCNASWSSVSGFSQSEI